MKFILSSIILLIFISCSNTRYESKTKILKTQEQKKLYKIMLLSEDSTKPIKNDTLNTYFDSLRKIDALKVDTSLFDLAE